MFALGPKTDLYGRTKFSVKIVFSSRYLCRYIAYIFCCLQGANWARNLGHPVSTYERPTRP